MIIEVKLTSRGWLSGKDSAGETNSVPGPGRSPGEGNGNPEAFLMTLCGQYSSTFFSF